MTAKILIIEDDQIYLDSLKSEFDNAAEHVITASDGEEAIVIAKSELPDIIIIDIMLPKKLGLKVIEELKVDEQTKFIPIIAVSNFGGDPNKDRALSVGATEFIVKAQLTTHEIAETARRYLPKTSTPQ